MKASPQWEFYREKIQEWNDDGDFARPWLCSTIVATMYYRDRRIVKKEMQDIVASGLPMGFKWGPEIDHVNLIHQRYHMLQWELANPETKIEDLETIFEIGGGYGAMALVASKLGFRGTYFIHDLPELEEFQRNHLAFRGVKCEMKWEKMNRPDLMIAIASLCEIPPRSRTRFLKGIKPRSYLLAYAGVWDLVDNTNYFEKWANKIGLPSKVYGDRHQLKYLVSTEEVE